MTDEDMELNIQRFNVHDRIVITEGTFEGYYGKVKDIDLEDLYIEFEDKRIANEFVNHKHARVVGFAIPASHNSRHCPHGKFWAVGVGRVVGIYNNSKDAEDQVSGFSGAKREKFKTFNEAVRFIRKYERDFLIDEVDLPELEQVIEASHAQAQQDEDLPLLLQNIATTTITALHQVSDDEQQLRNNINSFILAVISAFNV